MRNIIFTHQEKTTQSHCDAEMEKESEKLQGTCFQSSNNLGERNRAETIVLGFSPPKCFLGHLKVLSPE